LIEKPVILIFQNFTRLYKTETRPHFLAVVVVNENFIANCLSVENSHTSSINQNCTDNTIFKHSSLTYEKAVINSFGRSAARTWHGSWYLDVTVDMTVILTSSWKALRKMHARNNLLTNLTWRADVTTLEPPVGFALCYSTVDCACPV